MLLILRTLISETAGIDEADQLVVGQKLSWGYGPHAPLYTWLMFFVLRVFGSSEFSLTLLRESLLFGIYVFTYLNARTLTRSHAAGILAAVALQFHPSIVWESQRELTHSIVASLMVLCTLFSFLHLRPDRWRPWLALGLFGGLSILSKYNAALFYLALLIAALSLPSFRVLILSRRMMVSFAITILVILPNLVWALNHRDLVLSLVYKFGIHESMPWAKAVGTAMTNWFASLLAHLAPLVIVLCAIFCKPVFSDRRARFHSDYERLLARSFLLVVVLVALCILVFKVTQFKDRWLQPIFVCAPVFLIALLRDCLDRSRLKFALALGLFITIGISAMASGRLFLTEKRGHRDVLNAPFRKFAADLKPFGQNADFIVAGDYWLAGNLRLWFPDKPIFCPDLAPPDSAAGKRCLVVWDATKLPDPSSPLNAFMSAFAPDEPASAIRHFEETWKYHHSKRMKLGLCVLEQSESPGANQERSY